jgi:diguanylate cyclase (GGDEF)-like protein
MAEQAKAEIERAEGEDAVAAYGHEILVVEDELFWRRRLESELALAGYRVSTAASGEEALAAIMERVPDLVLLDMRMPGMDGTEVCRRLKRSLRTVSVPVIMLTVVEGIDEKVEALRSGANDYLIKQSCTMGELTARVKNALDLRDINRDASPLTQLPGNAEIERQLRRRVASAVPFAYLSIDIDDFKAFNDLYGHLQGDHLILATAEMLRRRVEEHGDQTAFIGHVGGDDFVVMCAPETAPALAAACARGFDEIIGQHIEARERKRGFIEVVGRTGKAERHRLTSLTVAGVGGPGQVFDHVGDLSARAAELKRIAKARARRGERGEGSCVVWDRRGAA